VILSNCSLSRGKAFLWPKLYQSKQGLSASLILALSDFWPIFDVRYTIVRDCLDYAKNWPNRYKSTRLGAGARK